MKILILISFCILTFISSHKSHSLSVKDYYQNTNRDFFKFFITKLFQDSEFQDFQQQLKTNSKFNSYYKLWLDEVTDWSFENNGTSIYFLQIYYSLNEDRRVLKGITLNCKDSSTLKKLIAQSGLNLLLKDEDFGLSFELGKNSFSTSGFGFLEDLTIKEFDNFPYFYFIKKTDPFEFYFKKWRIPIHRLIFKNKTPWGFVVP